METGTTRFDVCLKEPRCCLWQLATMANVCESLVTAGGVEINNNDAL